MGRLTKTGGFRRERSLQERERAPRELNGTLVKLPTGFTGKIGSHGSTFRAVVIQGRSNHQLLGETDIKTLEPGSYFGSTGEAVHQVSCETGEECIIYIRMVGKFDVTSAK